MRLWVSDASPIIALSWIGATHLLTQVMGTVLVPEAVRVEAGTVPEGASVVSPTSDGAVRALSLQLDPGEAAAVALAMERHAGLIVDERRARRVATKMGIPVVGTLGVVLLAWKRGIVSDPVHVALQLRERGLYLSDELLENFRRQVE
jgi:predicted nucleic acid-binding protein